MTRKEVREVTKMTSHKEGSSFDSGKEERATRKTLLPDLPPVSRTQSTGRVGRGETRLCG